MKTVLEILFLLCALSRISTAKAQADQTPAAETRVSASLEELWSHVAAVAELAELRGMDAEWRISESKRVLRLKVTGTDKQKYAWVTVPAPKEGWGLARRKRVEARITNRGEVSVQAMLWVVGRFGWSAVGDFASLAPGESRQFACDLRETFPDGTPKLDPTQIKQVQIMAKQVNVAADIEVSGLAAAGEAPVWVRPQAHLDVPEMEAGVPAAGRRVRYQLAGDEQSRIYCALYLPKSWRQGSRHPVIVEFPGNIFLGPQCYSTELPQQCVIGYSMSHGEAIWLSLPFIDRRSGTVVEDGFGDADQTATYAVQAVDEICQTFGGDRQNVVLTGFSRGAIACGYIGLRNDTIASLWKGLHGCQHYDGSQWKESEMSGAVERARRFAGQAIFQTDNSQQKYQPVVDATDPSVVWTWASSGLGFHSTAMFLDDRPSTQQLRAWYRELIAAR